MVNSVSIDSLAGGSLCEVLAIGDFVVKRYSGPIARGKEKLIREYEWLRGIAPEVRRSYPNLFPIAQKLVSNAEQGKTELYLNRLPCTTLTKGILAGELHETEAATALNGAIDLLINVVYRMRHGSIEPSKGYHDVHAERIALARKFLRRVPYMQPILDATELVVNGMVCPSVNQFLTWIDSKYKDIFTSTNICAFHGNFHLDNILYDSNSQVPLDQRLTFIDPRGELLGFAHFDFSKVLITLEAYYDEIHYGKCDVLGKLRGSAYELQLTINPENRAVYAAALATLSRKLAAFADIEGVSPNAFVRMVLVSECIHILSFCFYHAYNPGSVPSRIRAYIAVWAVLCRRLFRVVDEGFVDIPIDRLSLSETNEHR